MSYILEALKKSESERRQASSPPSIYSPKPPPPVEPEKHLPKSRLLLWLAFAGLAVLVLAGGYHLYGSKIISITITVPEEEKSSQAQNPEIQAEPDPVPKVEDVGKSSTSVADIQPARTTTATASKTNTTTTTADEISAEPEEQPQESNDSQTTPVETVSRRPSVPRLAELDTAFQNMVPELKLAGHVYSEDPSLRMILINNRIVRENGAAAKDLILEEITPDGIILRNGSIRFRIDIP